MRVGKDESVSTLENALSEIAAFGLKRDRAVAIVKDICMGVERWKKHYAGLKVRARDIDVLAQYIDGKALKEQRSDFVGAGLR